MSDMLEAISSMVRRIERKRVERGLPPAGHVCVMHPTVWDALREQLSDTMLLIQDPNYTVPTNTVGNVGMYHNTDIFVIDDAPTDKIEFMSKETMHIRYAKHFRGMS